jgi:GNAT superfamily N-acetyltransferase
MEPSAAAIALRPPEPADADALAALLAVLGYPCERADALARMQAVAAEPDQLLLIAELGGEVCGLLALDVRYYLPLGARSARITALAVARSHERSGVGRHLLREAEQRARAAGAVRIEVTSAEHRRDAHAFYTACGYAPSAQRFMKRLGAS